MKVLYELITVTGERTCQRLTEDTHRIKVWIREGRQDVPGSGSQETCLIR